MKNPNFNRREFLKLLALSTAAGSLNLFDQLPTKKNASADSSAPNIIIFLFDTLSAKHISLHGYQRETMPHLVRFAEKATVFHNHYSTGSFTTPGTASLLTGTMPWTHRALHLWGSMEREFEEKTIFSMLPKSYTTFAYTQNLLAEILLNQSQSHIQNHPSVGEGGFFYERIVPNENDLEISYWGEKIARGDRLPLKPFLYLGTLIDIVQQLTVNRRTKQLTSQGARVIKNNNEGLSFDLSLTLDWVYNQLTQLAQPFLSYVHLYPPHDPYIPAGNFDTTFDAGWAPPDKQVRYLTDDVVFSSSDLAILRAAYDQHIVYVDSEFNRFITKAEQSGMLENSYLVFTSDHGELFERGIWGHLHPFMYEPLTHIPLIIKKPGQTQRQDVFTPTTALDILPTIGRITGQPIPSWAEGQLLPTFSDQPADSGEALFFMDAKENHKLAPLSIGTVAMIKDNYKLIHYFGYSEKINGFELYDLAADPEERIDLFPDVPAAAAHLQAELLEKLHQVNQPFFRN